jgi:hypothetical protein
MTLGERQGLIDRGDSHLSIARQCQFLKVARSTLYYRSAPVSDDDLAVMRRLDEQYLGTSFYGARRMAAVLATRRVRQRRWPDDEWQCGVELGTRLPHGA